MFHYKTSYKNTLPLLLQVRFLSRYQQTSRRITNITTKLTATITAASVDKATSNTGTPCITKQERWRVEAGGVVISKRGGIQRGVEGARRESKSMKAIAWERSSKSETANHYKLKNVTVQEGHIRSNFCLFF